MKLSARALKVSAVLEPSGLRDPGGASRVTLEIAVGGKTYSADIASKSIRKCRATIAAPARQCRVDPPGRNAARRAGTENAERRRSIRAVALGTSFRVAAARVIAGTKADEGSMNAPSLARSRSLRQGGSPEHGPCRMLEEISRFHGFCDWLIQYTHCPCNRAAPDPVLCLGIHGVDIVVDVLKPASRPRARRRRRSRTLTRGKSADPDDPPGQPPPLMWKTPAPWRSANANAWVRT